MCEALRNILNVKIVLALLAISLSGNAYLAYKLNQIAAQLDQFQPNSQIAAEKTEEFRKNISKPLLQSKPVTSW